MPNIVRMIRHVTHMAVRRHDYRYKYLEERDHSQYLGINVRKILILNKYIVRVWDKFIWLIRHIPRMFPLGGGQKMTPRQYIICLIFKNYVIKVMS
jgi:hypothetical protein